MKFAFFLLLPLVWACSPITDTRGYVSDPEWKQQIEIGSADRDKVLSVLGSPSAKSTFGEEAWYYVSTTRESVAFFKPEVTAQQVTRITFDAYGTVTGVDRMDEVPSEDFAYVKRTTPTEGHSMTAMEQLIGNLGRFNKPGSAPGAMGRHGGPGGR